MTSPPPGFEAWWKTTGLVTESESVKELVSRAFAAGGQAEQDRCIRYLEAEIERHPLLQDQWYVRKVQWLIEAIRTRAAQGGTP